MALRRQSNLKERLNACAIYMRIHGKEFRKWRVTEFPVSIFFRTEGPGVIVLEALYAHRMHIGARLRDDIESEDPTP